MMSKEASMSDLSREAVLEEVEATLNNLFPHGHQGFTRTLLEKMQLMNDKNHDYASGGEGKADALGNFKRQARFFEMYPGLDHSDPVVVAACLMFKQVDALFWGLSRKIEHKVEGFEPRLGDILVYSGIMIQLLKDRD
jgi:hypothetical protein